MNRKTFSPWLALALPFLALPLSLSGANGNGRPAWDREPFTIGASELIKLASAEKKSDAPVVILKVETRISFDEKGRQTQRHHMIFRIDERSAIEEWSSVGADWAPWHEERPELRARVISPDGKEFKLDPATIAEAPAADGDPDLYSDQRSVEAPLPALSPGCVVEQETVIRDKAPYFDAGDSQSVYFSWQAPVLVSRVIVEAPRSLPLRVALRLAPSAGPVTEEKGGIVRNTFEMRDLPPMSAIPGNLPFDVPFAPYVSISTGASWTSLAARYHQIVEERIAGADPADLVKAAGDPRLPMLTRIDRVLARLHSQVRYTGVEFGSSALIPQTPATTLSRHFGDCKDKSALLIATLRKLGIQARMALLKAGLGLDVEAGLPGLGSFNHAIVVIPGNPNIWIDPTDPYTRAGDLPIPDQGRLALIADPGTKDLIKTPESSAADNRDIEIREIRLAESGPGTVLESSQLFGSFEQQLRDDFAGLTAPKLREHMLGYVKSVYSASELGKFEATDARDLTKPFEMSLEAKKAAIAATTESEAFAVVAPASVLERLSSVIRTDKAAERKADVLLPVPMTVERRYRILPPAGFVAKPLPEPADLDWGPVTYSRRFVLEKDGSVSATLRLVTPRRRFTPAELQSIRDELKKPKLTENVLVEFEQAGEARLTAGRITEAISEFKRLAALHPKKAAPVAQISRALLAGGLGDEARRFARQAIELEPKSPAGYRALGWVLQHDSIGRRFGKGFDREGALAAYRKAKALEPDDAATRGDLAILLEHDATGRRYTPQAQLDEAIEEYRSLKKDLKNTALDGNLVVALLRKGLWAEARSVARESENYPQKDAILLATTAMIDGSEAAIEESRRLSAQNRRTSLASAAGVLLDLREYPRSLPLLEASAAGAPNTQQVRLLIDALKKMERYETLKFPETEPESVIKRYFVEVVAGKGDVRPLLAASLRKQLDLEANRKEEVGFAAEALAGQVREPGLSPETVADIALARIQLLKEGSDETGYKIRVAPEGTPGKRDQIYIVIKEEGSYRLLGAWPYVAAAAQEALRRVEKGDTAGAKKLLDWLREPARTERGDDPLAGSPFARLWTGETKPEAAFVRRAAAALMADERDFASEAAAILQKEVSLVAEPEEKLWVLRALADAQVLTRNWKSLEETAKTLAELKPASAEAVRLCRMALQRQGKTVEADSVADGFLKKRPEDEAAIRFVALNAVERNDLATARKNIQKLIEKGDAGAQDYNLLAWMSLFTSEAGEKALENVQKANELTRGSSYPVLHTEASLLAELGRSNEAYQILRKAISIAGDGDPEPSDWYVFGRLAENYGFPDAARGLYQKAKPKKEDEETSLATWDLARKRLAALPAVKAKGTK
ncbi:MAG: DUF3857 domain-containing protein [Acidobacteria bacterium]|nr:DUF3857 domain-containing protein [Acidobacteriota bacterium]